MSVTITGLNPFRIHRAAYWAARKAYESHRAECCPAEASDPLQADYEAAYEPLVTAMLVAARSAVEVPAATISEIFEKIEIIMNEDLHQDHLDTVRLYFEAIARDARTIGGAA